MTGCIAGLIVKYYYPITSDTHSHPGFALEGIFDIVNSFSKAGIAQVNAIILGTKICNINVLID